MNEFENRDYPNEDGAVDGLEPIIDYEDLSHYELTPEEKAYEEMIRQRIRERRRAAERRRVKRNRTVALLILMVIVLIICRSCYASHRKKRDEEKASAKVTTADKDKEKKNKADSETPSDDSEPEGDMGGHKVRQADGLTYVDGILIVNKTYSLPEDYAPGINTAAKAAFDEMTAAAFNDGLYLYINSGYRSYDEQYSLYYNYAAERGVIEADKVSSRPGFSEHQSGLCFDVNSTDFSFNNTAEARWLAAHCAEYGFIIRYPKGKEEYTGYEYESWHIRFVGTEIAQDITSKGLCLEEYLGVTSKYEDSPTGMSQQRMAEMMGVPLEDPSGGDEDSSSYQYGNDDADSSEDSADGGYNWDGDTDQDYNTYY